MERVKNIIITFLTLLPAKALAAPLITDPTAGAKTSPDDVFNLVNNIKNIALGIVGVIIFAMVVYGGVLYIASAGNDEKIQKAKQTLTAAIVGLIIVICSYVIISLVATTLGGNIS